MKILVCIRQGLDGEINPFDACAYEAALQIKGAEVTIMSMGPQNAKDFLLGLTRLGAKKAILLSDKAFAGADTIATAYTLSLAVKKLSPDLIFCGRQTLVGDTAQTGPMLSVYAETSLITNVMSIDEIGESITCTTRDMGIQTAKLPALITVERINTLRLPSIMSKLGEVEAWSAEDIGADIEKCGLKGSPTRVLKTYENYSGKRKCKLITAEELDGVINEALKKNREKVSVAKSDIKLNRVFIVGDEPYSFAETVSDDITVLEKTDAETIAETIKAQKPNAVLWASDAWSKETAAKVAAMLDLGLCADCTTLETDGEQLIMYRPALSGSIIAKIVSLTKPAMATVRTAKSGGDIVVAAGWGAKDSLDTVKAFAQRIGADIATTRKAVDNNILPYSMQVGLTGKTVSPPVYIAVGISGAVHHIVGMQQAGTVIAVNPDKDAPIFDYADYGIIGNCDMLK
ncbi:MAG: FAD-binding protein [Acutalibacteraceae bacterium]|nr:FAD-binding protein [Acutalibacteraceae bacterium]